MWGSSGNSETDATNHVKKTQKNMATVTGFIPLPQLHTLGFHFSKWDYVSADIMIERSQNFTNGSFPVDVLWMDILWALGGNDEYHGTDYEYFFFNPDNFTNESLPLMNQEIEDANRYITVIVDPHIKVSYNYTVYKEGILADLFSPSYNVTNIFVKQPDGRTQFEGGCWPGTSVWIDYLNENAQEFWGDWFGYDKFVGSNSRYDFWNDMNEPAIFDEASGHFPLDALHFKSDGRSFQHRDLHNAYGAL